MRHLNVGFHENAFKSQGMPILFVQIRFAYLDDHLYMLMYITLQPCHQCRPETSLQPIMCQ